MIDCANDYIRKLRIAFDAVKVDPAFFARGLLDAILDSKHALFVHALVGDEYAFFLF
jgi:hypothetical protein